MQRDQAHRTNELLERIAIALEKNNKKETVKDIPLTVTNEIPGFEGVLNDLDNLYQPNDPYNSDYVSTRKAILEQQDKEDDDTHNDYLISLVKNMSKEQYVRFFLDMDFGFALSDTVAFNNHIYDLDYEEVLDCIKSAKNILDEPTSDNPDPYTYGNTFQNGECKLVKYIDGIKNDSDHDIRSTAAYYEDAIESVRHRDLNTKKDAILDYVTNEFGLHGARYTDIIKFAYYLGASNAPKYDSTRDRGYYSLAFSKGQGGYLIQGGKDYLVKGINKEGKERYFAHSSVDSFTDYYKRIS